MKAFMEEDPQNVSGEESHEWKDSESIAKLAEEEKWLQKENECQEPGAIENKIWKVTRLQVEEEKGADHLKE